MASRRRGPCDDAALKPLWEEYKYRHDLCWRVIAQITAAWVILAVLPYVETSVVRVLNWWVLGVPLLAVILVGFGMLVLNNEIDALDVVKTAYRDARDDCFGTAKPDKTPCRCLFTWLTNFRPLVMIYLSALLLLGLVNLVALIALFAGKQMPPTNAS